MPPAGREALLWKLADLIEQNAAEFAEIESLDKDEISPRDLKKIRAYVIHRANEDKKFEAAER